MLYNIPEEKHIKSMPYWFIGYNFYFDGTLYYIMKGKLIDTHIQNCTCFEKDIGKYLNTKLVHCVLMAFINKTFCICISYRISEPL